MTEVPVVIIGAGPTGLTAATLLAQYGVESLVLDRWETIYPQPRAVHLDDEVCRILGRLGLAAEFSAISWRCNGLRLLDRDMRVLAEFRRDAAHGRHGYPEASMFDQPELEALLRSGLKRHSVVTMRGGAEVTALAPEVGGVRVAFTDPAGRPDSVLARYVLGCDGANSLTRTSIGAVMRDLGLTQRWLVVDIRTDAELGAWEGVHQVCDPARAATYMRVGENRYRWEFQLTDGETADTYREPAALLPLIKPWTGETPADQLEIVRVAEYTFRAQVADRWRDRRVFLLGDAAHLTPPFIGQGMGAGMRDAMNLAWKLAGVLDGTLAETVLGSYEAERKPHATTMIRIAKLMGTVMTEGGEFGDLLRRVAAPRLHHVPGLRKRVLDTETPALRRSALVARPPLWDPLAGRQCPNAPVDGDRRLDDVTAGRFAVISVAEPSPAQRADIEQRGAVLVVARSGTSLHRWLRRGFARAAVVRPDGTVHSAGRDLAALCAAIPPYRAVPSVS
ncbi:bifunctional 3-(3-hydroxy-phenyl)propionate/3-hydroxycinnamic acid hydroxylase MhpA [Amycolatopsis tucumanensis]|uniref:Bifunctional 3-(3-hydroxy-phenyl)propionate/3-hydroxycinnamic acid hydroxylase n=1 Tax=Amycolatopsis tucumanensis TaxID=401106 RepID=A0ABP7HG72_9PSEU|nr:bifunctional 3-(3-hydroxy-phenyl)propionate/3-hydroxycinnamic acid hydroxylase [Amycolatopsis tucumanensis]MCF6423719.1 bifunctional 3-(3-hydroxy-phenyl)propionate/3-hydroxycinnamic acid hydroxylase [Amycolatopsis tucumanensis]